MTLVPLGKIKDNHWRNFDYYPIDDAQVATLRDSIKEHGFMGGVKVRPDGNGGFELACGHHRIRAAEKAGLDKVDILVDDMDDDQMIRLMQLENATQHGAQAPAVMNETAAAVQRLATILTATDYGDLAQIWARSLFDTKKAFDTARGNLLNGDGIGREVVQRYFGQGDEALSPRTKAQISEALTTLKQSGLYDQIMDELGVPEAPAEPEEETATPARKKKKKKKGRTRQAKILDERCASVFDNDLQFEAFRAAVTMATAQRFIPVDAQLPLAKKLMAELTEAARDRRRVGAPFIKSYVADVVEQKVSEHRQLAQREKERLLREQHSDRVDSIGNNILSSMRSMRSSFIKLDSELKNFPELVMRPKVGVLLDQIPELIQTMQRLGQHGRELRRRHHER
jgi:hypothetical protein